MTAAVSSSGTTGKKSVASAVAQFNAAPKAVTPPISSDTPRPDQEAQRDPMIAAVDRDFPAESKENIAKRERILVKLTKLVQEWTHEVFLF